MSYSPFKQNRPDSIGRAIILTLIVIITFILTMIIAAFLLFGPDNAPTAIQPWLGVTPATEQTPTVTPAPLTAPLAAKFTTLRSQALGFTVEYPADWHKEETALRVLLSPALNGLTGDNRREPVISISLAAENLTAPVEMLNRAAADFSETAALDNTGPVTIGGQTWIMAQLRDTDAQSGRPIIATLAAIYRNEAGYVLIASAPADQWDGYQPVFQGIIRSFRFLEQAVLRPTDATRPPTPTPTPTPRIYVVQSGDTLSEIAIQFGITVEALAARNGIEDARNLRTGQRLIIPTRRK